MIETSRLCLRPLQPQDAGWIAREIAHPDVHRWLTRVPRPYARQDASAFIGIHADDPWYRVVVVDGAAVGVVSIGAGSETGATQHAAGELGYWLALGAHGNGYMTEAAGALLEAYFAAGAKAVESGWIEGNAASENVLGKLGFKRTGETLMRHVFFFDAARPVVRVRMDRDQWHNKRQLEKARAGSYGSGGQ